MEPKRSSMLKFLLMAVAAIAVVLIALSGFRTDKSHETSDIAMTSDSQDATRIGTIDGTEHTKLSSRSHRPFVSRDHTSVTKVGDISSSHTRNKLSDDETSEPLYQEQYLAALIAMMEKDGKDNALIHYALAFEMAPDNPTPEQMRLIKQVLEEGWDERASGLLPYLAQWQAAFAEIQKGVDLNYARGIGTEMGANTPVPNFLKAQNAAKMLAVYSRYLESQGKNGQAMDQITMAMTMGRDFNSPDNTMISGLIGTAIQSIGLKQMAAMADAGVFNESNNMSSLLRKFESGQATMQQIVDTESEMTLVSLNKTLNNPDFQKALENDPSEIYSEDRLKQMIQDYEASREINLEYFSKPYWARDELKLKPDSLEASSLANFKEAEARHLSVISRMRLQQIDFAARDYMADHNAPAPDYGTLVNDGYLAPGGLIDPFTGEGFVYTATDTDYDLYGSGPNIKTPNDPTINWNPTNGTFSEGVIRLDGF